VEISKKAVEAMVDFFLYENIAFRLADSPKLLAWLDLYKKGGSQLATPSNNLTAIMDSPARSSRWKSWTKARRY